MNTNMTKAQQVQAEYESAQDEQHRSGTCYSYAVGVAKHLGGVETFNSNDGERFRSDYPIRTFKFDDESKAEITYGGVWCEDF